MSYLKMGPQSAVTIPEEMVEHMKSFVSDRPTFDALAMTSHNSWHNPSCTNVPWPRKRLRTRCKGQGLVSFSSPNGRYLVVVQLRPLYPDDLRRSPAENENPHPDHQVNNYCDEADDVASFIEIWNSRKGLEKILSTKDLLGVETQTEEENAIKEQERSLYLSLGMTRRQVSSRISISNTLLSIHIPILNELKIFDLSSSYECKSISLGPSLESSIRSSIDAKWISSPNGSGYQFYYPQLLVNTQTGQRFPVNLTQLLKNDHHVHTVQLNDENEMVVVHSSKRDELPPVDPNNPSLRTNNNKVDRHKKIHISRIPICLIVQSTKLSREKKIHTRTFDPSLDQGFGNRSGTLSACGRYYAAITTLKNVCQSTGAISFSEAIQVYDTFSSKGGGTPDSLLPMVLKVPPSVPFITQVNILVSSDGDDPTTSTTTTRPDKVSAILHGRGVNSSRLYQEWEISSGTVAESKVLPIPLPRPITQSSTSTSSTMIIPMPRIERHVIVMDTNQGVELYPIAGLAEVK